MSLENLNNYVSKEIIDFFNNLVLDYGFFAAIFMPMLESFFPIFPLFAIVAVNIKIFGFLYGFIFSWIGNCLGSLFIFFIVRYIKRKKFNKPAKNNLYNKIKNSIKRNDFTFLFLLFSFPFTPSFLVSGIAAASKIELIHFLSALIPGKFFMILFLSVIGYNVKSFFENPLKTILLITLIIAITIAGRKFLKFIEMKYEHD